MKISRKLGVLLLCLAGIQLSAFGQRLSFQLLSFPGLSHNEANGYFYGGGGFASTYSHSLPKGLIFIGLEYRIIDWGNQATTNIGYEIPYSRWGKFTFSGQTQVQVGTAFFKNGGQFVWGFEHGALLSWQSQKRASLLIGLGVRFSQNPAYKKFGPINRLWEIPLRMGLQFPLEKRD